MKGVRQADDTFICFGAKPDKGLGLEILDTFGSRQENARERKSWKKKPTGRDGEG